MTSFLPELRMTALRLAPLLVPVAIGMWSCGSEDASPAAGSGDVLFHADVSAIPGVSKDTGLQPDGSPVQLQLQVSASGTGAIDAAATASGSQSDPVMTARPGSGNISVQGGFALKGRLKVDISGLPSYDGDVPGLDNVSIDFQGAEAFDPYLLAGTATAKAPIPATDLPSIPLPGGLPGSLIIKIGEGSTVNLEFHGVCAAIDGAQAYYTGQVTRSGSLILQPRVELDVPVIGKKSFDIPEVTVPIAVPAEAVDLGPRTVSFVAAPASGETAKVGSCDPSDGGAGGGGGGAAGHGQGGGAGTGSGGSPGSGGTSGSAGNSGQGGADAGVCGGSACTTSADCCSTAPTCVNGKCASPCQACAYGACASLITDCNNNAACAKLWDCWSECTGTSDEIFNCSQGCLLISGAGQETFFRMQGCYFAKCHDVCGVSSCVFGSDIPECDTCMTTSCLAQCEAATDSADCMALVFCSNYCSGINCTVDCNTYPMGGCQLMDDCITAHCDTQCGGG